MPMPDEEPFPRPLEAPWWRRRGPGSLALTALATVWMVVVCLLFAQVEHQGWPSAGFWWAVSAWWAVLAPIFFVFALTCPAWKSR